MFNNLFKVKNCNQYEQARKRIAFFFKPIIRGDLQLFIYFYAAQFRHTYENLCSRYKCLLQQKNR